MAITPTATMAPRGVLDRTVSLVRPGRPALPVGRRFHHIAIALTMLVKTPRQASVARMRVTIPYWVPICVFTPQLVMRDSVPSWSAVALVMVSPVN